MALTRDFKETIQARVKRILLSAGNFSAKELSAFSPEMWTPGRSCYGTSSTPRSASPDWPRLRTARRKA